MRVHSRLVCPGLLITRDGTLRIPSRTRVACRDTLHLLDLEYADDTVMVDCSWDRFVTCAKLLDSVLTDFGVEMRLVKNGVDERASPTPGHTRSGSPPHSAVSVLGLTGCCGCFHRC